MQLTLTSLTTALTAFVTSLSIRSLPTHFPPSIPSCWLPSLLTLLLLCSRPPRAPQALQLTMQAVQLKMQGEAARQASGGPAIDEDVVKGAIMEGGKATTDGGLLYEAADGTIKFVRFPLSLSLSLLLLRLP